MLALLNEFGWIPPYQCLLSSKCHHLQTCFLRHLLYATISVLCRVITQFDYALLFCEYVF